METEKGRKGRKDSQERKKENVKPLRERGGESRTG